MGKRSKLTFALGLVALVAGAGLTYVTVSRSDPPSAPEGGPVLYAVRQIPAGTTGAAAVGQGLVKSRPAPPEQKPADALSQVDQLAGRTAAAPIGPGEILTAEVFPPAQTRIGTLRIPPGKIALALEMPHVSGVAGFAGAGDKLDIIAVSERGVGQGASAGPGARLILQNVEVLNVNGSLMAPAQGQPGAPALVFLLAVTPTEAERLVYLATFEQLYFSLVPKDQPPVGPTPGAGAADALKLP